MVSKLSLKRGIQKRLNVFEEELEGLVQEAISSKGAPAMDLARAIPTPAAGLNPDKSAGPQCML